MWQVKRFPYALPFPARSPTSFAIARSCAWYLMAWLKSPCDRYKKPRFPYAVPSPVRSPNSFTIVRSCAWYSMDFAESPCDRYALLLRLAAMT